jgi:Domain of unknown function (DUF1844)
MIGHEDENEEVQYKVADRRKFNADGSLRDGVVIEPAAVEAKHQTIAEPEPPAAEIPQDAFDGDEPELDDFAEDDEEIPGAKDPASFVNFLSTIATNAAAALGAVPHPATGQRSLDLETGKYWLDVIAMFREKTKGNLHPKEAKLLDGLLGDLRMQYVHMVKAAEEKLKAQAAQKFSVGDILGKK